MIPGLAPIPPDDPRAPKYWTHETSGHLAEAIKCYLTHPKQLTMRQISLIRSYCMQWINSPVWDLNPRITLADRAELARLRLDAARIGTAIDINDWCGRATSAGMDPL